MELESSTHEQGFEGTYAVSVAALGIRVMTTNKLGKKPCLLPLLIYSMKVKTDSLQKTCSGIFIATLFIQMKTESNPDTNYQLFILRNSTQQRKTYS